MGTVLRFTFLSLALLCGAAQAQLAYTAKTVNLRAGPARDFPVVAVLPAGFQIAVQGCVGDYTWCDVLAGDLRGWVYGGNIQYSYQNSYAPVITWGPVMGIAIIGFTLEDYWGRHYWRSPWYPERHRWADRQWPAPRPHVRPHQPPAPVPPGGGGAPPPGPPPRPPAGGGPGGAPPPPPLGAPPRGGRRAPGGGPRPTCGRRRTGGPCIRGGPTARHRCGRSRRGGLRLGSGLPGSRRELPTLAAHPCPSLGRTWRPAPIARRAWPSRSPSRPARGAAAGRARCPTTRAGDNRSTHDGGWQGVRRLKCAVPPEDPR